MIDNEFCHELANPEQKLLANTTPASFTDIDMSLFDPLPGIESPYKIDNEIQKTVEVQV